MTSQENVLVSVAASRFRALVGATACVRIAFGAAGRGRRPEASVVEVGVLEVGAAGPHRPSGGESS